MGSATSASVGGPQPLAAACTAPCVFVELFPDISGYVVGLTRSMLSKQCLLRSVVADECIIEAQRLSLHVSVCFFLFPLTPGIRMLFLRDCTSQRFSALDVTQLKFHEKACCHGSA